MKAQTEENIILSVIFVCWCYVFYRMDGEFSSDGLFGSLFLTLPVYVGYLAIKEIIRRYKSHEPIWTIPEPKPKKYKIPLWLRILAWIFD
jgi:hypothetical protein